MKIGEAMYKEQAAAEAGAQGAGAQPGGPAGGAGAAGDEKVVDAEFEEVDDKKKKSG
jgi:molecular chaperone DnaK